jgi:hypothetical protein
LELYPPWEFDSNMKAKEIPYFYEIQDSSPYSQKDINGLYPKSVKSSPYNTLFCRDFVAKILHAFLISSMI